MSKLADYAQLAPLLLRALRLDPPSTSMQERLAMLPLAEAPLQAPVEIRWNEHQVPYICAENDADLATALGIVHAHLRGAQIEAMRRAAQGRVSEVIGPLGIELDRALRLFDFGRTVDATIATLPAATRQWAEAFVAGINHVVANGPRPPELALLEVPRTAWTLYDLFTLARLCAADVSWIIWSRLLRVQEKMEPDAWAALWPRLLEAGTPPLPGMARGGSNSAAVGAGRSTGGARIASDPHLSTGLPSLWLLAGMHAPGFNAVGLMLPGLPFVAVGRNQHIAWGGTNLHAASSDLVDVSGLPSSAFTEREEIVSVRGRPPVTLRLRETEYGPVVTDGMIVRSDRPASLRWVGHQPSDEMTAMLGVNRATGWEEFRTALTGFAVPGQTMVYADAAGSVGQVIAAHLPPRHATPPSMLTPPEPWGPIVSTALDRFRHDPAEGFIASANDSPGGLPVGYFFAPSHRVDRLRQLLGGGPPIDAAAMRAVQTDVQVSVMPRLHAILLPKLRSRTPKQAETVDILRGWTGRYDADSRGALAWELLLGHLVAALRHNAEFAHYSAIWTARLMLTEDIARVPPGVLAPALALALRHTTAGVRRYGNWGAVHHIRLAHPLARLPLGERFAVQFPAPGSNDTLNKSGHGLVTNQRASTFGACARHVSDLEDPDSNDFVLLGGQDGWLGSSTFADQVALWRRGRYMTLPLRPETARARFPHVTMLRPG